MSLDPQLKPILEMLQQMMPPLETLEPDAMRGQFVFPPPPNPEPVAQLRNFSVPGPAGPIPIRSYQPQEGSAPFPLMVFFHGGGFVTGDLDSHDNLCRRLCNESACVVAAVDYRLAPEAKFPAAPEDCYAALCRLQATAQELQADGARVVVAGDSAGGNLAAVMCLMARDRGTPPILHQLLIYPVTDHKCDTPSYQENGTDYFLSREMMQWFWNHYLAKKADGASPYASPLVAAQLEGLPPATVLTAQYDPLRDEGIAYAKRLQEAGVPVTQLYAKGMIHGFLSMLEELDQARAKAKEIGALLRTQLSPA